MAVTIPAKAGKSVRFGVRYWQPGKTQLVNTTGYTARIQLRSTQAHGRVLLSQKEYAGASPAPLGTILTRVAPGQWQVYLSGAVTRSLPPTTRFEVELALDEDPTDTTPIFDGVINTSPQGVTND